MLVHARSPIQPVIVKPCGGWTKRTQEQMKLIPNALYTETYYSELQSKGNFSLLLKLPPPKQRCLYDQPAAKRIVLIFAAPAHIIIYLYFLFHLLDNHTFQLNAQQPAKALYEIERDVVLFVSSGEPFMSREGN
uniref:Uncharacterized protein n=1 Tax=Anser cygnoides TaxID=8845 RepID=A0A8B9EAW6_ANSCY